MDTTEIEKLIAIKKKSDSSSKIKQNFQNEWLNIAKADGLNEKVIVYLYEGFTFAGALPLIMCYQENKNVFDVIQKFFTGSDYADKNSIITSKLLLHMLAILFNKYSDDFEIIKYTIKQLPVYCKAEKGMLTDNKIIRKYFLQELNINSKFPDIDFLNMKTSFNSFRIRLLKNLDSINNEKGISEGEKSTIKNVKEWLNTCNIEDNKVNVFNEDNKPKSTVENINTRIDNDNNEKKGSMLLFEYINIIVNTANELSSSAKALQTNNTFLVNEIDKLRKVLEEKTSLYLIEKEKKQEAITELSAVKENVVQLSETIRNQESLLVSKDTEIKSREELSDILLRQKDEQKEIAINRISGDLKTEYKDFLSAADIPMSIDLGENMREQLKSLFSILKKHGIRLE